VTCVLKPGTQACIDALAAAGGLDTATEMQAVRGAIAQFDVAPAPRATEVVNPGPILERVPFSKE
jgi:hypothetical protein